MKLHGVNSITKAAIGCLTLILLSTLPIVRSMAQGAKRDPKVQTVIDQMIAAYKGLNSVHLRIVMRPSSSDPAYLAQYNGPETVEIKLQKPNKVKIDQWRLYGGKRSHSIIVCDGVNVWKWTSAANTYSKSKAPSSFAEIKGLPDDSPEQDVLFLNKDPFKEFMMGGVEVSLTLGGTTKVGDADTDSIEARIPAEGSPVAGTFRLRVGQKDHLVRSLSFEGGGKDPKTKKDVAFKFELTYAILNPSPVFIPDDFKFEVPPGAKLETAQKPVKTTGGSPAAGTKAIKLN